MKYQPGDEIVWIDRTGVFGGNVGDLYEGIVTGSTEPWINGERCYYAIRPEYPNMNYHVPESMILGKVSDFKKDKYNDAWDRAMRGI